MHVAAAHREQACSCLTIQSWPAVPDHGRQLLPLIVLGAMDPRKSATHCERNPTSPSQTFSCFQVAAHVGPNDHQPHRHHLCRPRGLRRPGRQLPPHRRGRGRGGGGIFEAQSPAQGGDVQARAQGAGAQVVLQSRV